MVLFPVAGLQRLYVGKIGTGLLWLFTFGLLGIGTLVDLCFIVIGAFEDRDGKPLRHWHGDRRRTVPHVRAEPPTPVNEYSSVPAAKRRLRWHRTPLVSRLVAFVGYLLVPLALLFGTAVPLAAQLLAAGAGGNELAKSMVRVFGTTEWADTVVRATTLIAMTIGLVSMVLILVARRHDGVFHMLRTVLSAAAIVVGVFYFNESLVANTWDGLGAVFDEEAAFRWLEMVLDCEPFIDGLKYLAVGMVGGLFVLACPPRRLIEPVAHGESPERVERNR